MSIANPYLYGHDPDNKAHARLKRIAAVASLAMAITLIVTKFAAYLLSNSVSLLSSLMDSSFDAMASVVTLVSIVMAAAPADRDHRFGHGKIEAVGALSQAIFIFAAGGFLALMAIKAVIFPEPVRHVTAAIAVMILSVALTAGLITFQRHVVKKTQSLAVKADRLHYTGDLGMNMGVLAAIGLTHLTGIRYFDSLFALGVAFILIRGAVGIAKEALSVLLDQELKQEERDRIKELVKAARGVRGIHDLRTRHSGDRVFIEFHIEVDGNRSIAQVHQIMDNIEEIIFAAFPKSEVLIHPEPLGLSDHRIDDEIKRN